MPGVEGLQDEVAELQFRVQGGMLAFEGRQQAVQGRAPCGAGCHRRERLGMVVVAQGGGIFKPGGFAAGGIDELEEGKSHVLALAAGLHAISLANGPDFLVPSEIQRQAKGKDGHEIDHRSIIGIRQVSNVNFGNGSGLDEGKFYGQKPFTQLPLIRCGQLRADDLGEAQRLGLLLQFGSHVNGLLLDIEPELAGRASGRCRRSGRRGQPVDPDVEAAASWLGADGQSRRRATDR